MKLKIISVPISFKGGPIRRIAPAAFGSLVVAALETLPQPASALIWDWSFQRDDTSMGPAFGELTTTDTPDAQGRYRITGVSGERNSMAIEGLIPTDSPIPGSCRDITAVALVPPGTSTPILECFKPDNLLRREGNGPQLTPYGSTFTFSQGFGVRFADGTYTNFFSSFVDPSLSLEFYSIPPFEILPASTWVADAAFPGAFQASPRATAGPEARPVNNISNVEDVPVPLPISGALMCFGWARQLRRRQRAAR
ncbi:MAG: hypothetical protein VKK99_04600 [Cyanobacteriota bacterium]|nr:hypothetical protein [Cyanobacteriota bacterium]